MEGDGGETSPIRAFCDNRRSVQLEIDLLEGRPHDSLIDIGKHVNTVLLQKKTRQRQYQ